MQVLGITVWYYNPSLLQLKVAQGVDYKLEESMKMETELIELRAERAMMAFQVC